MNLHPHSGGGEQQYPLHPEAPQTHGRTSCSSIWTYIHIKLESEN